jgi:hypothetical protein
LFVVIVAIGGYAVLVYGTHDREETEIPEIAEVGGPEATAPDPAAPVTMLDGQPAPEGVYDIAMTPGEQIYLFTLAEGLLDEPTESEVPKSTVEKSEDQQHLTITMQCAVSDGSMPAMLRVTEDPFEVNVTPVVVGQSFGPACPADQVVGTITVPLEEPVGARRLVLARGGRQVPLVGID